METEAILKILFKVVGGLGIFLLGMKNMSEGMQAVAGERLRRLINAVTNNRFLACGVGAAVTCLVQSSSITTVMVVGMVNAGVMTLVQSIGVILGANIGTTITGWILVLKVGKYGLPILGVAAFFFLFSKRDKVRFTASVFVGFGMIFFGLELMKNGFAPIKELDSFVDWFSRFSPMDAAGHISYLGVMKCALVGALLTAIVQSSSATLGITIGLATMGVIDYYTAAALVLGENIGTTITAILASLGASNNAKRASYAHMMVNVLGVVVVTAVFALYTKAVLAFVGSETIAGVMTDGEMTFPGITKAIAATHTGFNVINVIIFLPMIGILSKLLYKIVPEKDHVEMPHLTFLDVRMLDTPAIGIQQSQNEILKMSETVSDMFKRLRGILELQRPDEVNEQQIFNDESNMDMVQKEVVEFLGNIMSGNIPHEVIDQGRHQLRLADEYESISDYITNVLKLNLKMRDLEQQMTKEGLREMLELHDAVTSYIDMINASVRDDNADILLEAETRGKSVTRLMKECRTKHLDRVEKKQTTALKSLIFTDMLNAYRRIKDHGLNIAEVMAGEK